MTLTMANGGQIYVTGSPESENGYAKDLLPRLVVRRSVCILSTRGRSGDGKLFGVVDQSESGAGRRDPASVALAGTPFVAVLGLKRNPARNEETRVSVLISPDSYV